MVCLALKLIGSWVVVGFSVGMEAFGRSHYLKFHVVFLVFSGFGLKSPASGFQFYSSVVSRLLQLYSTDNKTSRLMAKRFSPVRDTQRGSQSYKKRRGRREIEMSRSRKGGLKRRETDLCSCLFPECSP